jgi:hypothetical protein
MSFAGTPGDSVARVVYDLGNRIPPIVSNSLSEEVVKERFLTRLGNAV